MKINNPMTYVLAPLIVISIVVLSCLQFATDLFDGTPVYSILMGLMLVLIILMVIGEKLTVSKVCVTCVVLGGLVALCMWNAKAGILVFGLLCFGLLGLALARDKKESAAQRQIGEQMRERYGEEPLPRYDSFPESAVREVKRVNYQEAYTGHAASYRLEDNAYGVNVDCEAELEDLT